MRPAPTRKASVPGARGPCTWRRQDMTDSHILERGITAMPGTSSPGVAVPFEVSELLRALARKDEERAAIMRRLEVVLGMQPGTEQRKRKPVSRSEFARRCGLGG